MRIIWLTLSGATMLLCVGATAEVDRPPARPSAEVLAPMVLNGYSRFPRNIGSAPVYNLEGRRVGSVQKLDADPNGRPAAMEIWLPTGRTFTVVASNISYDEQQNIIIAGLTDAQLGIVSPPSSH
jgi:hypothetical protein